MRYNKLMERKNLQILFLLLVFWAGAPVFCFAEITATTHYKIDSGCAVAIKDATSGDITCKKWQRGSQVAVEGIDVGTCICANTCLVLPANHYYYDDPVNKTKQTDEKNITLPVVLAWNNVEAWQKEDGEYVWYWMNVGGKESITSKIFGARSYLLEIDNTNGVINDSKSQGGIFRKILKTNEFNPAKEFFPCFFNSGREIKWRVRPCCNEDGSNCLPESQAEWWTFTTSFAPEPVITEDPDWNGNNQAINIPFKGFQIKWCPVWLAQSGQFAKSYRLMVNSDEKGSLGCHPLMKSGDQCKDDDILSDPSSGEVVTAQTTINAQTKIPLVMFPIQGRQDHALFTRNRTYAWKVRTCFDDIASNCSAYGQTWKFSTRYDPIGVPAAINPKNSDGDSDLAGLPLSITWTVPDGANSFIYQTSFINVEQKTSWSVVPNNESSTTQKSWFDAPNLKADTQYTWRVRACSKFDSTDCDAWSQWFTFRTTGRPPKSESLTVTPKVPTNFFWEAVSGAKSYRFSLFKSSGQIKEIVLNNPELLKNPKYTLDYPDIDQEQSYTWKVQTCAHTDGTVCGPWSQEKPLAIPALAAPINPNPAPNSTVYADQVTHNISWDKVDGASAYHYTLALITSQEKQPCDQPSVDKIVSQPSEMAELNCLGIYNLTVQPCVDSACQSIGPKSEWTFTLGQQIPQTKSVFTVCGAGYDNDKTPWNERESCQIKHILLLIKITIDFLLFKLAFWLLPIMALATGLIFYSQFKAPEIWEKVKSTWRAIAIGYGLLFFAWLIVGVFLQVAGFSGLWFKIL